MRLNAGSFDRSIFVFGNELVLQVAVIFVIPFVIREVFMRFVRLPKIGTTSQYLVARFDAPRTLNVKREVTNRATRLVLPKGHI